MSVFLEFPENKAYFSMGTQEQSPKNSRDQGNMLGEGTIEHGEILVGKQGIMLKSLRGTKEHVRGGNIVKSLGSKGLTKPKK